MYSRLWMSHAYFSALRLHQHNFGHNLEHVWMKGLSYLKTSVFVASTLSHHVLQSSTVLQTHPIVPRCNLLLLTLHNETETIFFLFTIWLRVTTPWKLSFVLQCQCYFNYTGGDYTASKDHLEKNCFWNTQKPTNSTIHHPHTIKAISFIFVQRPTPSSVM